MKPSTLNPLLFTALLAQLAFADQYEDKQAQPVLQRREDQVMKNSSANRQMFVKEYMKANGIEDQTGWQ